MKVKDYMKMVRNLESNDEYIPGENFLDLIEEYENFGLDKPGLQSFCPEQEKIIKQWSERLDKDLLANTPFYDKFFLAEFLKSVPEEEQFKYVENTNNYHINMMNGYDPQYVIVTRRAVPSLESKPEQFWSTNHYEVVCGLSNEIPIDSPQRKHSIIMVSTVQNLYNHGKAVHNGGTTDGEIVTSSVPFNEQEMLFVYKPIDEIYSFISYIKNGGIKNQEMLKLLRESAKERIDRIGLKDEMVIEDDVIKQSEIIENEVIGKNLRLTNEFLDSLNQSLLQQKVILPNGNKIKASHYIEEIVRPLIPQNGKFKLKNGIEVSARQYIEEFVLGEGQTRYNGDIEALMRDTLAQDDEPSLSDGEICSNNKQELKEEQFEVLSDKIGINLKDLKKVISLKRIENEIGFFDIQETQSEIALRNERGKLIELSKQCELDENDKKRLEELNALIDKKYIQNDIDKSKKRIEYTNEIR